MIKAIEPLAIVLQSGATPSPAIIVDAAATLSVGIAAFATGYTERGIGSATTGTTAKDDDLFANELVLMVLPETFVILALVVIFAT